MAKVSLLPGIILKVNELKSLIERQKKIKLCAIYKKLTLDLNL